MTLLLVITWVCVLIVVMGLFYYVWDDRNKRKLHEHRRVEISELAMIFQTLRDVVSEQKILAKEFNEQVEEKISLIREVVNEAQNRMQRIQQDIYEQSQKLKELQDQIDGVFRQENVLKNVLDKNAQSSGTISIIEAESVYEELIEKVEGERKGREYSDNMKDRKKEREYTSVEEGDGLCLKEKSENSQSDSLGEEYNKNVERINEKLCEDIAEEEENIRDAYKSLLIGSVENGGETEIEKSKISTKKSDSRKEELTPVQKMVMEYHQAGMTTAEIAKELGIPKGEVRLILSLAISKSNKK